MYAGRRGTEGERERETKKARRTLHMLRDREPRAKINNFIKVPFLQFAFHLFCFISEARRGSRSSSSSRRGSRSGNGSIRERESECRQRRHTVQSLRPREVGANVCTSCSGRGGVRGRAGGAAVSRPGHVHLLQLLLNVPQCGIKSRVKALVLPSALDSGAGRQGRKRGHRQAGRGAGREQHHHHHLRCQLLLA